MASENTDPESKLRKLGERLRLGLAQHYRDFDEVKRSVPRKLKIIEEPLEAGSMKRKKSKPRKVQDAPHIREVAGKLKFKIGKSYFD